MDPSALAQEPILIGTTNSSTWAITLDTANIDSTNLNIGFGSVIAFDPMVPYIYLPIEVWTLFASFMQ